MYVNHNLFAEDSWTCALCFLLDWTWQRLFNFSQNLDNCLVFAMRSLQFSFINIFLSFRRYIQFHSNSSEIWERKKERKRERVWFERLESHKFIGIIWCDFYLVSQWVCFGGIWVMKFENLFILDSITLGSMAWTYWVCSVAFGWRSWCDCQKCEMRESWKIESVSEWIRRREGETVRLTGECVLEEEWMTDICISFGMWNNFKYLQTERCMWSLCLASPLYGFVIYLTKSVVCE